MDYKHYVPILKGKAAEYGALGDLKPETKRMLTPLIEIPPFSEEDLIDDHVAKVGDKILKAWGTDQSLFIDFKWIPEEIRMKDGSHPLTHVFNMTRGKGIKAIPVTWLSSEQVEYDAIKAIIATDKRGMVLRIGFDDFEENGLSSTLSALMSNLGVSPAQIDIVLDLDEILKDQAKIMTMAAKACLEKIPMINDWRSLIITGSSFPADIQTDTSETYHRAEWSVWNRLLKEPPARIPTFSDYAIERPEPLSPDIDPRFLKVSPQLRYTTEGDWFILKARSAKKFGYQQFNQICRELISSPAYQGEDFSAGDKYIKLCAQDEEGPGNATTWRRVGFSHHMEFVAKQIASLSGL